MSINKVTYNILDHISERKKNIMKAAKKKTGLEKSPEEPLS